MRLSLATAACVVSVALLAGCSNSPTGTSSVPGTTQTTSMSHHTGMQYQLQPMPKQLSREQVAKLHPNALLPELAKKLAGKHFPKPNIRRDGTKPVTNFLMDDAGYIWGLHKKKVVAYHTDCSGAEGGRVDHNGRLIVACTNSNTVNIYDAGNVNGSADVVLNGMSGFYPADAFIDNSGRIYASNLYGFSCTTYYCYFYDGNIEWWDASNQSSGASPSGSYTDPNMYEDYFADVDASGNVYLDGFNTASIRPAVDEISGITGTSPTSTVTGISLEFPGGVYVVTPNGPTTELSIQDQGYYGSGSNELYLYTLPGLALLATLHSPQNFTNTCDPVSGGYNQAETQVFVGDAGCRAGMLGTVANNKWKTYLNLNYSVPIDGAFVTSDK